MGRGFPQFMLIYVHSLYPLKLVSEPILDLQLCRPTVSQIDTSLDPPVLSTQVPPSSSGEEHQSDSSSKIDRKSKYVSRSILVQIRSPDIRRITERVDQGVYNRSLDVWTSH